MTQRYTPLAIFLHWCTALAVLGLLGMGWVMVNARPGSPEQFTLFQWHKSTGLTVLAITIVRLLWRWTHRPPVLPSTMLAWERSVAEGTHKLLYGLLLVIPVTGWAIVSSAPFHIPTMLFGQILVPHLSLLAESANKAQWFSLSKALHLGGGLALLGLLVGHSGAAFRHHFVQKDDVLIRMLPRFFRHGDQ